MVVAVSIRKGLRPFWSVMMRRRLLSHGSGGVTLCDDARDDSIVLERRSRGEPPSNTEMMNKFK
jgi:hypothetical protein